MTPDQKNVMRAARLAKISLAQNDMEGFMTRMSRVLEWIKQLQDVSVAGVAPLANPMEDFTPYKTPFRNDEAKEGDDVESILQNAPKAEHHMFSVPKVIE